MATYTECGDDLLTDVEIVCDHFETEHGYFDGSGGDKTQE